MNNDLILQESIQKLFDKGSSVLFRCDSSWNIDYVSDSVLELLAYSSQELIERKVAYFDCIKESFVAQVKAEFAKALKSGIDFFEHKPYKIITKDKKEKWVSDQSVIQRDSKGTVLYYVAKIRDITKSVELHHENELLHEREALALDSTHDGVWDWDIQNDEAFFSYNWKKMLGYNEDEIQNTSQAFFDLIHPDDKEKTQKALQAHLQNNTAPYLVEIRLLCKDGTYKWILSRGKVLLDKENKPKRMLGLHVDISYQKNIEERLQESEFRWKFAIEGSGDGLWDWNLQTDEVFYSLQWKKMLGYEESDIAGTIESWKQMVHPNNLTAVQKRLQAYMDGRSEKYISEHQILCKDGSYKWVLDRGVFVQRDKDGKPTRMIGTHTDIDETKKIQEKLKVLSSRFTNMFENHDAIMLLVDPQSDKIIDANKSAQHFYGYSYEEFTKLNIGDINIASKEQIAQYKKQAFLEKVNCFHFEHKKKNGTIAIVETHTSKIQTDEGDFLFSIIMDVTKEEENEKELKRLFEQLQKTQKMAKIGLWEQHYNPIMLEWSEEVFNIFEIDSKKVVPSNELFEQMVHPSDVKEVLGAYEHSLKTQQAYEITHRIVMKDQRIKYVLEQCDTEFDDDGTPIISRGTVQDITKFEMLDAKIRSERKRFKTFMDNASDGILIIDKNHKLIDYSKVAQKLLGYDDKEMLQLSINDWDLHSDQKQLDTLIENLSETPMHFERIHKRKDDSTYNASLTAVAMEIDGEKYIYTAVRDVSEITKLQNAILYEKNFIETIIESSNAVVAVIDSSGRMIKLNRYAQEFTGYTLEEISREPYVWKSLLDPSIQEKVLSIIENAKEGHITKSFQNEWHSKSGEARMFEWSNTLVNKEDGSMDYIVAIGIDITKDEEQQVFLDLLINSQSHMIVLADGEDIKYVNQAVLDFFEFANLEQMKEHYRCICDTFLKTDFSFSVDQIDGDENWVEAIEKLNTEEQVVSIHSLGDQKDKTFKINVEHYKNKKMYLLTFIDISDTMKKQFELKYKSNHDPLTQANNREYFYEKWYEIVEAHRIVQQLTAIAIIDIDLFKKVNDDYGHDVGDEVLKILVKTLKQHLRQSDTLIRWGGEEFLLLLPIKDKESLFARLDDLRKIVEREVIPTAGSITISVGAALYNRDHQKIEETIKQADNALYHSKDNGRNQVTIV